MATVLPPFPAFSVHEDDASVGPRWKKWLKRFQMYLAVHDIKDTTRKRALLLYSAGEEVSDVFETLPDRGEDKEYDKAVAVLKRHCHGLTCARQRGNSKPPICFAFESEEHTGSVEKNLGK